MKDTGGPIKSYNIRWRMMKRSRSKHKPEKWNISSQQVKIFKFLGDLNHAKMFFLENQIELTWVLFQVTVMLVTTLCW